MNIALLLLKRGAAVNAGDENQESPLLRACRHERRDMVKLLLEHKADAKM